MFLFLVSSPFIKYFYILVSLNFLLSPIFSLPLSYPLPPPAGVNSGGSPAFPPLLTSLSFSLSLFLAHHRRKPPRPIAASPLLLRFSSFQYKLKPPHLNQPTIKQVPNKSQFPYLGTHRSFVALGKNKYTLSLYLLMLSRLV